MIEVLGLSPGLFEVLGYEPPEHAVGFSLWRGEALGALVVVHVVEGRWMASVKVFPGCPRSVHAHTVRLREALAEAGVEEVFAVVDAGIPRAEEWMRRLGFEPQPNGEWRIGLGGRCHRGRRGRGWSGLAGRGAALCGPIGAGGGGG